MSIVHQVVPRSARKFARKISDIIYLSRLKFLTGAKAYLGMRASKVIYYESGGSNFGDVLNEHMLRYFHCPFVKVRGIVKWHPHLWDALCIGSILQCLLDSHFLYANQNKPIEKPITVFGSGFIRKEEEQRECFVRPVNIVALRGRLSQQRCERILKRSLQHIALGDPGLLIRRMFPVDLSRKLFDVGIIYHCSETKEMPGLEKIKLRHKNYTIIDIRGGVNEVVSQIAKCRFILSSAMHPLICADSLGIPNRHMIVSDLVEGGTYKFRDYYSVFPGFQYEPLIMAQEERITDERIDALIAEYSIKQYQIDNICDQLEAVFPLPTYRK